MIRSGARRVCRAAMSPFTTCPELTRKIAYPLPPKSFGFCSSKSLLPQPVYNLHLRCPHGTADSKRLTWAGFRFQTLCNQQLRDPLGSADSKGFITPAESAVTKNPSVTSLESAVAKKGGGGWPSLYSIWGSERNLSRPGRELRHKVCLLPTALAAEGSSWNGSGGGANG